MRRYISSITPSLFALLVTLCVAVPGFAQSTTIRGGNSANTAAVSNSALSGTEAGLVVRCASGCSGSGGGGAAQADNSALSDITGMGALYDSTPPAVTDGNVGIPRMSSNRNLYVTIRDAAGNERGLNIDDSGNLTANITGTVTVGSHAVTNAGTFAVQAAQSGTWNIGSITTLPSLPAGSNNIGDVDVLSLIPGVGATSLGKAEDAAHTTGDTGVAILTKRTDTAASSADTDGDYAILNTDANGALWTTNSGIGSPTDTGCTAGSDGTLNCKVKNLTALIDTLNTTLSTLNAKLPSAALMAEDSATPTLSEIAVYPKVFDSASNNWDFARKATADSDGVQTVRTHAKLTDRASGVVGITDGSSTSVVAAQGSGVRFCATTIVVSNSSATNVTVDLRDGTAGSVLMTIPAAANMGGGVVPLPVPICTTANTAMAADPSAAASTVTITAVGFKTSL